MNTVAITVALALALAGCHHSPPTVWPKSAGNVAVPDWKDDGGQSLEPQSSIASDIEASDDATALAAKPAVAPPNGSAPGPASPAAPPNGTGEVILNDDIIIEEPY